jgi:transcriptional regulator with XRE-family HTH domain
MDFRQRFALNIRERRLELGLSQEELASKSQLHPTHISKLERGKCNPLIPTVMKLLYALDVPIGRLYEGTAWNVATGEYEIQSPRDEGLSRFT